MRIYDIECPCGNTETVARDVHPDGVACDECGTVTPIVIKSFPTPAIVGVWTDRPMSFGNISQKFTSQKELDAYCEKRGVTVEAPNSDARKYIADMSRENAEQAARDNGFRDLDHYHNATLDERRDRVAATREAESKKRVSIFGSDAKVAADDKKAWKDALPT